MKRLSFVLLLAFFTLTISTAVSAFAQTSNVMDVHVDKAVAIPGHVLLPGDYVFRLMDSDTYPGIVQISSADGRRDFGFIQAYASQRENPGGTKIVLSSPDSVGLARVMAWYFPGERSGYSFIYSKRDLRNTDMVAQRIQAQSNSGL